MAFYYVYSGATGAGDGSNWTNAYTTLTAALNTGTTKNGGDIFYIANDHNESTAAALTLIIPGGPTAPNYLLSVKRVGGSVPPVAADLLAGASIASSTSTITIGGSISGTTGYCYAYGITFKGQFGITLNKTASTQTFEKCTFTMPGGGSITSQVNSGRIWWLDCTFKPANAGSGTINITSNVEFRWRGGLYDGSAGVPGGAPLTSAGLIEGVDFSQFTSINSLGLVGTFGAPITFIGCKLPTGATSIMGSNSVNLNEGRTVYGIGNDIGTGTAIYSVEAHAKMGDMTTDTGVIRTGGASDGTTGFSRKVVLQSTSGLSNPFTIEPVAIWNDTVGSPVTVTICGISNLAAGALPNNDDIWIDVDYFSDATSTKMSHATSGKATVLDSNAACASDSSSWGGSPTGGAFKMSVTVTPQQKGYIYVNVKCAKASTTFYVDPLLTLS